MSVLCMRGMRAGTAVGETVKSTRQTPFTGVSGNVNGRSVVPGATVYVCDVVVPETASVCGFGKSL